MGNLLTKLRHGPAKEAPTSHLSVGIEQSPPIAPLNERNGEVAEGEGLAEAAQSSHLSVGTAQPTPIAPANERNRELAVGAGLVEEAQISHLSVATTEEPAPDAPPDQTVGELTNDWR